MDKKDKKWVKKGLFWVESPEEKNRVRSGGKQLLLAALILGVFSIGAYYILTAYNLQLVGIEILKLFGIIALCLFFVGIWELITGNEPPSGI